jgi:hypothetical protein
MTSRIVLVASAAAVGVVMMFGAEGRALADTVVYATGFEPPTYTTGALSGQNGWTGSLLGTVETTTVFAGSQAVEYNAIGVSGQTSNFQTIPAAGQGPLMQVTVHFYVSAADPTVHYMIMALDGNAGFIGQVGTNGTGAEVGLGLASSSVGHVPITTGAWNSYTLDIDFATQTQTAFVDSTLIGSGPLASASTSLTGISLGINETLGQPTSQGYFDNLSIDAVPAPIAGAGVPGMMTVLVAGGLLGWRRKRKAKAVAA